MGETAPTLTNVQRTRREDAHIFVKTLSDHSFVSVRKVIFH